MRIGLGFACIFLLCNIVSSVADEPPRTDSRVKFGGPAVDAILREASEIALKQDEEQPFWIERVLLRIGELQIRAGDFDGALKSIRGSTYDYGRNAGFVDLAEALARDGKRERAFKILRLLDSDHGWRQDYLEDSVQLRWIEHLISSGDMGRAGKAVEQLKSKQYRSEALRKLAVGYASAKDSARAAEHFKLALDVAASLKDDSERGRAMWETAEAQVKVRYIDAAKATIRKLQETPDFKDPWDRYTIGCAVLSAKAKDEEAARRLFLRAFDARNAVDSINKSNALMYLAKAQAGAGFLQDALKTAYTIPHGESEFGQALCAIAVAQEKSKDSKGAIRTALSIERYPQYRDDAIHDIVDYRIAKRDFKAALAAAEKADNPSRRAAAILKVAVAHAKSGDYETAAAVAGRIELTPKDELRVQVFGNKRFNHKLPSTWGDRYDDGLGSTMGSYLWSSERAAEVAGAAMTLAQALGDKPAESYAVLFDDINTEEIIRALARAHAVSGDANEALGWAKKIGNGNKANSDDHDHVWAVKRRINALIGVAEGLLERSGVVVRKPGP